MEKLFRAPLLLSLFWTFLLGILLAANVFEIRQHYQILARNECRAVFDVIVDARAWNALHGGVYVPLSHRQAPNPYLDDPRREVTTTDGQVLTKINPAFMTRQIAEIVSGPDRPRFHITSLRPIRPGNAPDPWETAVLSSFEAGGEESAEFLTRDGATEFRYMAPLRVDEVCLPCHARQGYKTGEVRGGISVTIDAGPHLAGLNNQAAFTGGLFLTVWISGVGGIVWASRSLMRKTRQAEAASQAKSRFLAVMSHEFRTPINGILGMTDLTLSTELTPEQRENLDIVRYSARSLLALTNDILDYSRLESDGQPLDRMAFDPRDPVENAVLAFADKALAKGLDLTCHVAPDTPTRVLGDPHRFHQVVSHLVANAVAFTEKGHVAVRLEARADERDPRRVRLAVDVADSGPGIAAEPRERIFESFTQIQDFMTRGHGGVGLGLPLCLRLAERMDGGIEVESEPGRGSLFRFTSLLERDPEAPPAPAARTGLPPVLVVIAGTRSREIVGEYLRQVGFLVIEAPDAAEAASILAHGADIRPPGLVVAEDPPTPAAPAEPGRPDGPAAPAAPDPLSRLWAADPRTRDAPRLLLVSGPATVDDGHEAGNPYRLRRPPRQRPLQAAALRAVAGVGETS